MPVPTPRQAPRRHTPARTALFTLLGLLAAACGGAEENTGAAGPESQDVHLQPVATAGPDPFTASSATGESAPVQPPVPNATGRGIRTVGAATPGLYGGTRRLGSCDVEQQLRALTAEDAKAAAFAGAAGVEKAKLPEFLRGLTPVVLRADTRVTSHGFRDGSAHGFQAVLQAGTAVLVDGYGMPRVRCACGNPLLAPRAPKGSPVLKGEQWSGYQANQVIVIEPTPHPVGSLLLANTADNTWIERTIGDAGARDRTPQPLPAHDPADGIPTGSPSPAAPAPARPPGPPGAIPGSAVPATPAPPPGQPVPDRPLVPEKPAPRRTQPQAVPPRPALPNPPTIAPDVPPAKPPQQFRADPAVPPDPPSPDGPLPWPDGPADPAEPYEPYQPNEPFAPQEPYDAFEPRESYDADEPYEAFEPSVPFDQAGELSDPWDSPFDRGSA
ncbi:DUF6777 domain-containing protein [Streptomyces sp. NPDC046876]|uniref:DUF6777 domain-containing protein n=1 Tax=Streptomyces sp. NPDC046876 TaxID=3155616 RepID=UPI0033CF6DC7